MNFLQTVLAFLLALGPLILFHELGHYLVARLCDVKVLRFSIGMGKVLWWKRLGEDQTEWVISALPLGGYVKMLDSREFPDMVLSEADKAREFTRKSVWRRIAIVAAGPIANFLLAIIIFAGLYMNGVTEPGTRLRETPDNSSAYEIGLRGGDKITAINEHPVKVWSDLRMQLVQAAVERDSARVDVERPDGARYVFMFSTTQLAKLDLEGDILDKLGLDLARPPAILGKIAPGGPAAQAGLRPGDHIDSIDGVHMIDGLSIVETIRKRGAKDMKVEGRRDGESFTTTVHPEFDAKAGFARIKAELNLAPELVTISYGPFESLGRGAAKTWENSILTLRLIGKMVLGEVSWRNVTGPITIADYAGQTARIGAVPFLSFIAAISISLGVMNLLPIPVLDGGHLLYYSLEVLTGRPLPERVWELAQRAGLGLLVALMALAVFNDVARLL